MTEPRYVTLLRAFVEKWNRSAEDPASNGGKFDVTELADVADAFEEEQKRLLASMKAGAKAGGCPAEHLDDAVAEAFAEHVRRAVPVQKNAEQRIEELEKELADACQRRDHWIEAHAALTVRCALKAEAQKQAEILAREACRLLEVAVLPSARLASARDTWLVAYEGHAKRRPQ